MPYRKIDDPQRLQALLGAVLVIESDLELPIMLRRIVESACELTEARYGALGVLDPERRDVIAEFITVGLDDEVIERIGHFPTGKGILGHLIKDPTPLRLAELSSHPSSAGFPPGHPPMHSFIGVPVRVRDEIFGNLYLTDKLTAPEFSEVDVDVLETLSLAAGIAIENARLHSTVRALSVAADRDRIARDLHDTVIQRLYGIGLALQGAARLVSSDELRDRLQAAIDELDNTILQVRTTIFELEDRAPSTASVRGRILDLAANAARGLGFEPAVRFVGPIEATIEPPLAAHLLAVIREALSNVARHAQASRAEVEVRVEDHHVIVLVDDDGIGLDPRGPRVGNGLGNMGERAQTLLGSCTVNTRDAGGTEVRWSVPL